MISSEISCPKGGRMKKMLFVLLALFVFLPSVKAADTELMTAPWNFVSNAGSIDLYQSVPQNVLNGKVALKLTYDLRGTCLLSGDASAIIFDQNGWKYISLSNYGTNCQNGPQTVTIPLSSFVGLNTAANLTGFFHGRTWLSTPYNVTISSAILLDPPPTPTPTPTATPTPTSTPTPTATPTPTPTPNPWTTRGIDVMKYTKDVVCNQPSQATIDTMVQKAVDLHATHVAISTPYENPSCGNSLTLTTNWVNSIRNHGLKVWHRHTSLSFEGIYGVAKKYNGDYLQTMSNYVINNPTLFQSGDIFTPYPEPEVAGINGVTWCGGVCQFSNASDFNQFLRNSQTVAKLSFQAIGVSNVKVGYYGTNGFIVFGENNPDWYGKSFLEPSTVTAMDNVISMDSYPESYAGGTMAAALDEAHVVWPSAQFVIGEWGTITATNSAQAASQINTSMGAASTRSWVKGFNYWNLGPSGNEGLLNNDLSNKSQFTNVQNFFK